MAKKKKPDEGLPYFKFVISKWTTGNIQQCSLSAQGLFMNLCVLYWGQRGDMLLSKMHKRFPRKQKQFYELVSESVIKLIGDEIEISFLDDQLEELGFVSQQNRKNAIKGWEQRKSDATASLPQSDGKADAMPKEEIREEKKKEEEIREENDARIENDDFKYVNPVPREAIDLTEKILDYFSASKDVMSPIYSKVENFIAMIFHRGEFDKLKTSFDKYRTYKARSQEQIHSIEKWIGTVDAYFKDGQWTETNWELKLKNYEQQSTKGIHGSTGAKVTTDGSQYAAGLHRR